MFEFIKSIFNNMAGRSKEVKEDIREYVQYYTVKDMIEMTDFNNYPDPEITNPEGSITVMYMDDSMDAAEVNNLDLDTIKNNYLPKHPEEEKIFNDIKFVKCYGRDAGQIAMKYLRNNKVDKALLDLTLAQSIIAFENGQFLDLNGTDIAIELFNKNSVIDIAICTSHTLARSNSKYSEYISNFEDNTGVDIFNHYINRLGNRTGQVIDFLFTDKYRVGRPQC